MPPAKMLMIAERVVKNDLRKCSCCLSRVLAGQ